MNKRVDNYKEWLKKNKVKAGVCVSIVALGLIGVSSVTYVNASNSEDYERLQLISNEISGKSVDLGWLHFSNEIEEKSNALEKQKENLEKTLDNTFNSLNINLDAFLKLNDTDIDSRRSELSLEEQVQYLNALASVDDMVYIKGMDNYEADKSNDKIKTALKSIQSSVDSSYESVIKELSGESDTKQDTSSEVSEVTSEVTTDKKVVLTKKDINEFLKSVNFDKKLADEVINVMTSIEVSENLVESLNEARANIVKQVKIIDTEVKSIKKKEKEEAEAKKKAEEEAKAKAEAEALAAEQAEVSNSYSNDSYYSSNNSGYSSSASNSSSSNNSSTSSSSSSSSNSEGSSSNSGGSSSNSNSGGGATVSPPTYAAGTVGALGVSACESVINSSYAANGWNIKAGSGSSDYIGITGDGNTSCSIANIANGSGKSGYADVVDNGNGTYTFHFYLTGF